MADGDITSHGEAAQLAGIRTDQHGTAQDAIDFALDVHDDSLQTYEFLQAWRIGDLAEWPEYYTWLKGR